MLGSPSIQLGGEPCHLDSYEKPKDGERLGWAMCLLLPCSAEKVV